MKNRCVPSLLLGILTALLLCILSGCSILPSPARLEENSPALELHLDTALLEDMVLSWDPSVIGVEETEVSITENGPSNTVTVTIRLCPAQT